MPERTGLEGLLTQLKEYGFHSSAIAAVFDGRTEYIGWYKQTVYIEDSEHLNHLGALIGIKERFDAEQDKSELMLGIPNRRIVSFAGMNFRHLSSEEMLIFRQGYEFPQENIDASISYDFINWAHLLNQQAN